MTGEFFIYLSLTLFAIGLAGIFTRRDAISIFLAVELILNAANVLFVGYAKVRGDAFGHVAAFIVIAVAAVEAAVGLSIVIRLNKQTGTLELSDMNQLKG